METYKQAKARLEQASVEELVEELERVSDELLKRNLSDWEITATQIR
jgi:hypothetical protein